MEEEIKEEKKKPGRQPKKKKYYIGYQYVINNRMFVGNFVREFQGAPDIQAMSKEICERHRTNQCVIVSLLETS